MDHARATPPPTARPAVPPATRPSPTLALIIGAAIAAAVAFWVPGVRVVDGDTVDHGFWRWRLVGFDTPEIRRAACPEEARRGRQAAARVRDLVAQAGQDWDLVPVPGRDAHRRRLGRLLVTGRDVGATLVAEGLARPYTGRGRRDRWCGGKSP